MNMVATVRRTAPGPLNPAGQPTPGVATEHDVACRAWEVEESTIANDGRRFSVTVVKVRFPLDADVKRHDSITVAALEIAGDVDTILLRNGHQLVTLQDY